MRGKNKGRKRKRRIKKSRIEKRKTSRNGQMLLLFLAPEPPSRSYF